MIRPFTVVCMLMAVGSGLYLYQCKHQAQMLDREIARTIKQTDAARDRIGMLRAEWAQLNEPERVAELARAHSALQTAKPTQFVAANDLASKLPAPVAPTHPTQSTDVPEDSEAVPAEPPAAPVAAVPAAPAPRVAAAAPPPEAKPAARAPAAADPKPVQTAGPAPAAEPKPAHRVPAAAPEPAAQVAAVHPLPHPMPLARPAAPVAVNADATAPGTVGAAVLRAMRAREAQPAAPAPYVQPAAAPAYSPPASPQSYVAPTGGSMLGGARGALPPPVPFAAR